jgi:hypothetical protein
VNAPKIYDIFISHAWRYHEDWMLLSKLFDAEKRIRWRNFSVPWYDPALDPNTELGARAIRTWLEGQIRPIYGFVLLDSVYAVKSARKWLDLEVELARGLAKPVIALPAHGQTTVSQDAAARADESGSWDIAALIEAFERIKGGTAGKDAGSGQSA